MNILSAKTTLDNNITTAKLILVAHLSRRTFIPTSNKKTLSESVSCIALLVRARGITLWVGYAKKLFYRYAVFWVIQVENSLYCDNLNKLLNLTHKNPVMYVFSDAIST